MARRKSQTKLVDTSEEEPIVVPSQTNDEDPCNSVAGPADRRRITASRWTTGRARRTVRHRELLVVQPRARETVTVAKRKRARLKVLRPARRKGQGAARGLAIWRFHLAGKVLRLKNPNEIDRSENGAVFSYTGMTRSRLGSRS